METLWRFRNSTTVVTANEEVQTNTEAQVYVHDIDLFVMVQILDETLAVQSLGKIWEDHGYTYEWASGQKPHLTNQGKKFFSCKTHKFVPLVVPGWSFNSGTSSSSTSPPQDSRRTSSIPAPERSDEPAPGNWRDSPKNSKQKQKEGQQSRRGRLFARLSGMVRGDHRKSRSCRSACTRTHFSWLRFGTSCKSGSHHKVFNEEGEWIQFYSSKTETSQET